MSKNIFSVLTRVKFIYIIIKVCKRAIGLQA